MNYYYFKDRDTSKNIGYVTNRKGFFDNILKQMDIYFIQISCIWETKFINWFKSVMKLCLDNNYLSELGSKISYTHLNTW